MIINHYFDILANKVNCILTNIRYICVCYSGSLILQGHKEKATAVLEVKEHFGSYNQCLFEVKYLFCRKANYTQHSVCNHLKYTDKTALMKITRLKLF